MLQDLGHHGALVVWQTGLDREVSDGLIDRLAVLWVFPAKLPVKRGLYLLGDRRGGRLGGVVVKLDAHEDFAGFGVA